ncbi:DNA gyrase inhibitor YacG [Legionella birminghamensis]|uniref:DNA gyrase inhibitor YacG n=1 Tax=Legionella birminghamensis TaxID=28083 RepID=A0A378ID37_9GAMM|nr:DNA gyrase inhibitor YacG [Legionella birminghamensis]KTC75351.1 DNA gyrase inhibitor YacG [Legionella birminghamensis]STX33119.1 DNA gyrase inhibitor YacG [Legionella birminghamensis]
MQNQQKITCPTCGKANTWTLDNTYRPFCSDRCKLIDLGEWAAETRKIPGTPVYPQPQDENDD